jgi:hypothetical protein
MTTCLSWAKQLGFFCHSLSLSLSISSSTRADWRAMIVNRARTPQAMNSKWKALPLLGPYYGKDWFIKREGKGAFDPVINRTPAQAAAARLMPKPPNLETYAAALARDEIDKNIIMEWGLFVPSGIDRGDWINAMIKDHKFTKHTVNTLLLYPLLESHCSRCTQIHDPRHRNFSSETCVVLSDRGPLEIGGFFPCKYIYCATQPMHARKYCPRINLRCFQCLHRSHAEVDKVCCDVYVNRALFEDSGDVGWVTTNRFRQEGSASGFFPVLTLPQVCHVENTGAGHVNTGGARTRRQGNSPSHKVGGPQALFHTSCGQAGVLHGNVQRGVCRVSGGHNAGRRTSQTEESVIGCQLPGTVLPRR